MSIADLAMWSTPYIHPFILFLHQLCKVDIISRVADEETEFQNNNSKITKLVNYKFAVQN